MDFKVLTALIGNFKAFIFKLAIPICFLEIFWHLLGYFFRKKVCKVLGLRNYTFQGIVTNSFTSYPSLNLYFAYPGYILTNAPFIAQVFKEANVQIFS